MSKEYRAAVDQATGRILYGGWADTDDERGYDVEPGLSPGQTRVVFRSEPDLRKQRYDRGVLRNATSGELSDSADVVARASAKVAVATADPVTLAMARACAKVIAEATGQDVDTLQARLLRDAEEELATAAISAVSEQEQATP